MTRARVTMRGFDQVKRQLRELKHATPTEIVKRFEQPTRRTGIDNPTTLQRVRKRLDRMLDRFWRRRR